MPVVIKRVDGGVSIIHLIGDADADEEVNKWKESANGEYVSHFVLPDDVLPENATPSDVREYVKASIA